MVDNRALALVVVAVLLQKFRGVCSSSVLFAYKALDGELFILQCASPHQPYLFNKSAILEQSTVWFWHEGEKKRELPGMDDSIVKVGNSLWFSKITEKHSGNYSCYNSSSHRNTAGMLAVGWGEDGALHFLVDVVQRNETVCHDNWKSEMTLVIGPGSKIACPDVRCYTSAPMEAIRWYKNHFSAKELTNRQLDLLPDGQLFLGRIHEQDNANFTCDLSYVEELHWTFRRTVRVKAIPPDTKSLPNILYPHGNKTEEVELGKRHTLTCKVQFGYERNSSAMVRWWVRYHDNGSMGALEMDPPKIVHSSIWESTTNYSAHLEQVTQRHLEATFTCWAQNSRGNASATIRLQRRPEVAGLLLIIVGPAVTVVLISGISILVWIYWLEIYLLYRTYFSLEETVSGKEYDAFVSYVSDSSSEEEHCTQTGETLGMHHLPNVLEKQYGYRLCLLQRDLAPGGVYTEDVVWAMQRSRRVICVLSSCYLRSSCLFELETSLEALQQDRGLRLILVWSSPAPPCLKGLPLPPTVRRALRVLPALHWSPSQLRPSQGPFWKALKRAMPISPLPPPSSSAPKGGLPGET
ncbi:hypothetical protein COCON_G00194250 [Conger conger]|uniref:Uncharacterized protein n=1 Tax=Conger conger TaxID=82655 RepID=A0A9Q1D0F8_CONCO|nr:hypothetical protein COCON_G00194250 [Conger conger]